MLASNDNSYMKEYVRRQRVRATRDVNGRPGGVAGEKLLTDRGEYIRFLESQLDAVTQACLTAQSFDERILSLGAASVAHDEKILNLARLIKCSQGVAEEQEAAYRAALDRVHRRVAECERAARETAETENRKILAARALLAKKGLVGGAEPTGADGTSRDTPTAALDVGVLDAQFRAWAEAHERATDAKLLAAENRLAARVDAAVADVLDAVRNAERRLTEEAPGLAESAARTVWGKIGGERGTLPRGGVASGGDVRDVAERVSRCEANDDELRAQMRAVRELQQTHQRRLETLRDETSRLERRAATEPRARGGDEEFAGFWAVPNAARARETDAENVGDALARSVEASARGFERLDAQFAELRARVDARDADAARLAEAVETLRGRLEASNAVDVEPEDDRLPAATRAAEASAWRAARTSVERAVGVRAVRTSPANSRRVSPEHSPDRAETRGGAEAEEERRKGARREEDRREEANVAGFAPASRDVFAETDARREKLARLYRRLEEIASPQPKG